MEIFQFDQSSVTAFGATLLRFILAGFWIAHCWFKVGYRCMAATEAFFMQHELPAQLAWFVVSFEIVVAACLILGLFVPAVCLLSLPILLASMWVYRGNGFFFAQGGIELPAFWALAQIVQMFLGLGALPLTASMP
jgi:uncharacterized membrane protein YphA (DoxX/SURF4 family)